MRSRLRLLTFVVVALVAASALVVPIAPAAAGTTLTSIGAGVRGPDGLTAAVYAKGVKHASAFAVDAQGRLWIATAAGDDEGADAIWVVNAAGATPQKIVADLQSPLGLVWVGDTLYASVHGGVLALAGFDGTSFASRTSIVSFPDGTGEVNGIALGPDGRLYVGISAPCDSCTPSDALSASVVSFATDGSGLAVFASDIRAPIGLAFFPGTDDLFVTMNQRDDLGNKTPGDWLAVVREGQSWGFPSCYGQDTTKCASTPAPVAELHEHAAVSGVAIVTGQLGSTVGTGAAVAEWMTGAVRLVHLTPSGSSYSGKTTAFLTGFENPVAVLLDPSGALLVGDWTTGKIYRVTA